MPWFLGQDFHLDELVISTAENRRTNPIPSIGIPWVR